MFNGIKINKFQGVGSLHLVQDFWVDFGLYLINLESELSILVQDRLQVKILFQKVLAMVQNVDIVLHLLVTKANQESGDARVTDGI